MVEKLFGGKEWVSTEDFLLQRSELRITELQDLLIERFVEHRQAVAEGQEERVKTVEAEIDSLLREKEDVEKWAAVGSA